MACLSSVPKTIHTKTVTWRTEAKHSSCGNGFFLACRTTSSLSFNSSDTVVHSSPQAARGMNEVWCIVYHTRPDSAVWLLYEWTGHGLLWLAEATWRLRDLMFKLTQPGSVSLCRTVLVLDWVNQSRFWVTRVCLKGLSHNMKARVYVLKTLALTLWWLWTQLLCFKWSPTVCVTKAMLPTAPLLPLTQYWPQIKHITICKTN